MSTSKQKTERWDGPNKRKARSRKVSIVAKEVRSGFLPKKPRVLSFAGASAHFERGLFSRNLTTPENITTIQTSQKMGVIDGGKVLRKLIKVRDEFLPGMKIWPHTFRSFTEGYTEDKIYTPAYVTRGGTKPAWLRTPTFRREMDEFMETEPEPFDVLDIDICGTFSEATGSDITRLMEKGALGERGVLFINHLKGRDNPGGKLFEFLRDYFHECELFDVDSVVDEDGCSVDLNCADETSWWLVRYRLVPIYYVIEAYKAGYDLRVERLVEYRDRNKKTKCGVNMLQWYFNFRKLESPELLEAGKMAEYGRVCDIERYNLHFELEALAEESYEYDQLLD